MGGRSANLVVVPAYNESATISDVLERIAAEAPGWDVVVIDDGSTDDTERRARVANARVLRLPFNLGIGGAVQAGFTYALEHSYERMVQIDADGQHDAAQLAKLVAVLDGDESVDVVCGSRFLTEEYKYPAPFSRRTGINIFAFLLSRLVGQPVTDPTSGFRLYNRRAISLFARDYPHDYPEVEAVLMMHHHDLTVVEVPVQMHARGGGASSITSGKSAYYMVKVLLALFVGMFRRKPVPEAGDAAPVRAQAGI